jgi:predicted hotdog family 3-hydroxylacyl-ACP dehydratase
VAIIVVDGKAYRAMCGPVVFGDYLQTSLGLLLVDGVVHFGGHKVLDCARASEESGEWASGLSGLMGGMRAIELTEIVPAASNQSS